MFLSHFAVYKVRGASHFAANHVPDMNQTNSTEAMSQSAAEETHVAKTPDPSACEGERSDADVNVNGNA